MQQGRGAKDKRELAICKVARDVFSVELSMEHRDSERRITMAELRRALELAYDEGRKAGLS